MARHSFFQSAPKQPAVPPHQSATSYQPYQPQSSQQTYQSHQTYQAYEAQIHHPYQLYQAYQPFPPPSRPAHPAPGHPKSQAIQSHGAVQQIQYIPYFYQVSPLSPSPRQSLPAGATLTPPPSSQPKQNAPAPKRPAPPRLSPLIIPVRKSPPPVHIRPEPPRAVAPVRAPAPPIHAPVPQKPPVPAKIPLNTTADEDIDFFQFQYPCMLPPSTIPQTETISVVPRSPPAESSPRYSLPVLPSHNSGSASSSLRRSKPYLQSRRQRLSTRDAKRRAVSDGDKTPTAQPEEEEWADVMHVDSAYDGDSTPVAARPETPLEYQVEQAAALHALLGLVLEGKADVAGEDHERAVAILEEEVELAARGFRKFSADEYVKELREMMGAFDSPCE